MDLCEWTPVTFIFVPLKPHLTHWWRPTDRWANVFLPPHLNLVYKRCPGVSKSCHSKFVNIRVIFDILIYESLILFPCCIFWLFLFSICKIMCCNILDWATCCAHVSTCLACLVLIYMSLHVHADSVIYVYVCVCECLNSGNVCACIICTHYMHTYIEYIYVLVHKKYTVQHCKAITGPVAMATLFPFRSYVSTWYEWHRCRMV